MKTVLNKLAQIKEDREIEECDDYEEDDLSQYRDDDEDDEYWENEEYYKE